MSRYRDDRDDYYNSERGRSERRREEFYDDDRQAAPPTRGGGYERGGGSEDYGGGGRERERYYERPPSDYGRADYEPRYGRGDYDEERTVVRRTAGSGAIARRRYEEDDSGEYERGGERGGGRSILDEGRDFFRRTFGGRPARRPGGPSRSHVRCRDIMTRDVTVATRETTLEGVARMMRDEDTGVIPVIDRAANLTDLAETDRPDINRVEANVVGSSGKLVGLITDRDIVVRALAEGKDPRTVRAEEIMTTDIHTAHPNDRVVEAVRKMGDKQVRRIPILDRDGTLRGIISMADVALETEDDHELAEALEEISSGSTFWNRVFG
ncbi:MAG TPA: CBS domain-containing protein [Pyrinomonadaceae bacterium]